MKIQQGDDNLDPGREKYLGQLNEYTRKLVSEDATVFLHQSLSSPVMNMVSKLEGPYFEDVSGKKYLDCHGNGVHNIGYNHPEVIKAISDLLESKLTFSPRRFSNQPAIELARHLIRLAPEPFNRVLFCPGGSEAVEMALYLARLVTGKYKTISFYESFHGATALSASVGGNPHFDHGWGPLVPGCLHVEYPHYYRNPWKISAFEKEKIDELYLQQIRNALKRNPDISAIIGTPISSTPQVPSNYFWLQVKEICREHDALLIFDEIVCGLGRTGRLFASEHYVDPDIIVMGKSLGGGVIPFAGILTRDIYNVGQEHSIGHFTHEKSPLGATVAMKVLEILEQQDLVENARQMGIYLHEQLMILKEEFSIIGHIEGKGLLLGIDLVTDRMSKKRAYEQANKVMYHCLEAGLSFKIIDGNVIALRPALTIGKGEVDHICSVLKEALTKLNHD